VIVVPVITGSPLRLAAGKRQRKAPPNYFPCQIAHSGCSIPFGHGRLRYWVWLTWPDAVPVGRRLRVW